MAMALYYRGVESESVRSDGIFRLGGPYRWKQRLAARGGMYHQLLQHLASCQTNAGRHGQHSHCSIGTIL